MRETEEIKEEKVKELVEEALKKLIKKDGKLLEIDANERSITHKLAEYLQKTFPKSKFPKLVVDCEYNRNTIDGEDLKKILNIPKELAGACHDFVDTEAKTVFPDIIVHERGNNNNNILVIEVKKTTSNRKDSYDKTKLNAFKEKPCNYKFALFIKFHIGREYKKEPYKLEWYPFKTNKDNKLI